MNRRTLLLSVACVVATTSAHAGGLPVVDVLAIAKAIQQIEWMRDQYQLGQQQLRASTNTLDLNGVAPGLLSPGIQNPFGQITGQINGIVNGTINNAVQGAQKMLQQDRAYTATGNDFTANTLNSSSTSLANLKAMQVQLMNSAEQRLAMLDQMQAELQSAPDMATVERINGRIALENQVLATQSAQIQHLREMIDLQEKTIAARYQQRIRSDDEETTAAISGSNTGTTTSSTPVTTVIFQAN